MALSFEKQNSTETLPDVPPLEIVSLEPQLEEVPTPHLVAGIKKHHSAAKEEELVKMVAAFKESAGQSGTLNRERFQLILKKMGAFGLQIAGTPFENYLFELLDQDQNSSIDVGEFLEGMTILLFGTPEEKLKLTFAAYDSTKTGKLYEADMCRVFQSAWMAGLASLIESERLEGSKTKETWEQLVQFSFDLAAKFAKKAMAKLDSKHRGYLTFNEFKLFAEYDPKITTSINGFSMQVPVTLLSVAKRK